MRQLKDKLLQLGNMLAGRNLHLVFIVVLWFVFEYEYKNFVNLPLFQEKMGFDYSFDFQRYFITKISLIGLLLLNLRLRGFYYFTNVFFLVFITLPNLVMFEFMPNFTVTIPIWLMVFHVLLYASNTFDLKLPFKTRVDKRYDPSWLFFFLALLLFVFLVVTYGISLDFSVFKFDVGIYEIREAASLKRNLFSGYFYSWMVKIVLPTGLIFTILKRKYWMAAIFLFMQIYLFMVEGQKSAFFALVVLIFILVKNYHKQVGVVLVGLLFLIPIVMTFSYITGNLIPESIIVRRIFFLPAIINHYYFLLFDGHHLYYSHSVLRHFVDYPYDLQPQNLVGKFFFDNPKSNVNSGFISDGFMNFGHFGVLLNVLGVVILIKLIAMLRISGNYSGVIIIVFYTLINSFFTTSLLTHGIILFLILSFLFLRDSIEYD